ncbi:MAG: formyltetrahydrofolate deformylase [Campylobacterota bacterium]|nr:formyltetrahydrofolate deformylase [Campylobacterota bacterium]
MQEKAVLLIETEDERGLVYKVSSVLYEMQINIDQNAEFVEKDIKRFFMRSEISGKFDESELLFKIKNTLPEKAIVKVIPLKKKRIVLMVTKEPHCLGDLLVRHKFGELNATIEAVIGNHDTLKELTEKFNIPFYFVDHSGMSRHEHEEKMAEIIDSYKPEYIVLAKFMRVLNPEFVKKYENKIINIHHSFLPAFIGAKPYQQAYERGVKIIGATAHFVNNNLDEGPIIAQSVISVDHSDSAENMAGLGRDVEKIVLARALKLAFEDRVFVNRNKTVIFE